MVHWLTGRQFSSSGWGRPDGIGLELRDDLDRLLKRPLTRSIVARQPVSRKGSLQSVSLSDVATLQPAYRQDSGSFIPKSDPADDVGRQFPKALKAAANGTAEPPTRRPPSAAAWDSFGRRLRRAALGKAGGNTALADPTLLEQAEHYGALLRALAQHAPG